MLYKTNNECLSFVRWYRYFHSVKDEISYSTWLRLVSPRSASVMDCHATARGSIPGGNGIKTELYVLRCRWDVKHNQLIKIKISFEPAHITLKSQGFKYQTNVIYILWIDG